MIVALYLQVPLIILEGGYSSEKIPEVSARNSIFERAGLLSVIREDYTFDHIILIISNALADGIHPNVKINFNGSERFVELVDTLW